MITLETLKEDFPDLSFKAEGSDYVGSFYKAVRLDLSSIEEPKYRYSTGCSDRMKDPIDNSPSGSGFNFTDYDIAYEYGSKNTSGCFTVLSAEILLSDIVSVSNGLIKVKAYRNVQVASSHYSP